MSQALTQNPSVNEDEDSDDDQQKKFHKAYLKSSLEPFCYYDDEDSDDDQQTKFYKACACGAFKADELHYGTCAWCKEHRELEYDYYLKEINPAQHYKCCEHVECSHPWFYLIHPIEYYSAKYGKPFPRPTLDA